MKNNVWSGDIGIFQQPSLETSTEIHGARADNGALQVIVQLRFHDTNR
jgi:hypothetical protein